MCISNKALVLDKINATPAFISAILSQNNISYPMGMMDNYYYGTSIDSWHQVLQRLITMPWAYKSEVSDCDKIALRAHVECSVTYGLNTLMFAVGSCPQGPHAFNLFMIGAELWVFEPQLVLGSQYFPYGEEGYKVVEVLV